MLIGHAISTAPGIPGADIWPPLKPCLTSLYLWLYPVQEALPWTLPWPKKTHLESAAPNLANVLIQ